VALKTVRTFQSTFALPLYLFILSLVLGPFIGSRVCKEWKGLIGPLPENIAQLVFKPQPAKSQPLSKKPDIVSKVVSIGQVSDRLMDQVEKQQAQAIAASEDLGGLLVFFCGGCAQPMWHHKLTII
jgi:hypothetical protein